MKASKYFISLLLFSLVFIGCGGDDQPKSELSIEAASERLIGLERTLSLRALINSEPVTENLIWSSSNSNIGTVNSQGIFTSKGHGEVRITVEQGDLSASVDLSIYSAIGMAPITMDNILVAFLEKYDVPGAAYAVVKDSKLVMARGYGIKNTFTRQPVDPTSLFRLASVSKPITGVATLKLVDEGLLDLDEKVFEILDEFLPVDGDFDQRLLQITVRQLLHHTSGSNISPQPMFTQRSVAQDMGVSSPPNLDTIMRWFTMQRMQSAPGSTYAYHNMNYVLLGRVIEAKTGMTYEQYVKSAIFNPIGATSPRIGRTRETGRFPGEVSYYNPKAGTTQSVFDGGGTVSLPNGGMGAVENMDAHGGWIASVVDLARFAVATDGRQDIPDIISTEMQTYMINGAGVGYGAGWAVNSTSWNHTGGMPGTASVLWVEHSGLMIICALNSTPAFGTQENSNFFNELVSVFLNAARTASFGNNDLFDNFD